VLPTFKFELEKSAGKVIGNSIGREATVEQLPISKGIAGVSMILEPGVMRELHWHATAAEWAFVISGRVRTTVIDPAGYAETNDFEPGDIWYFPRGHGHVLCCLGDQPTPKPLLAKNFGLPESAFDSFPKEEVYFARGPLPSATKQPNLQGREEPPLSHKFRMLAEPPHSVHKGGREWRVDSSRFPISTTMTGVVLDLEPGGLRELHWHPTSDEWQYVIEGHVSVTLFGSHGRYRIEILNTGDVGYIPQGFGHSVENIGNKPCRILLGFNTGLYQAIDLSQWIAGNPAEILATNFDQPASLFEKFPRERVFIAPQ
jgi:oxalate decarboxylase